jgi:mRNA-degrading endonuclease RelE of RelBE toxin-antitoxin system
MLLALIYDLKYGEVDSLDIKPLAGNKGFYRIRKGRIRLIVTKVDGSYAVVDISWRDNRTYKDY